MKSNHGVYVLMAAGAAVLLLATPSIAMDKDMGAPMGHGAMGPGHGPKNEKAFWKEEEKSLGLTEEQRAKMKVIREEMKAQQESSRSEMKAKHEALRQELDAEKPNRGKAEALVKEIGALEQKMGLGRVSMIFKIREILTPEQYKKLQAFHEKKKAEMKERHGKKKAE
jgi:Spy/CpxP family protein refolding chaperone